MKLVLSRYGTMECIDSREMPVAEDGRVVLAVVCCAICRTDAKMWQQGHRDLLLPRVLGHEIAAIDAADGRLYTVWPGQVCGTCRFCRNGRENLCDGMRITGFHADGGFARYLSVPRESLIPVQDDLQAGIVTFAEPVACVLNGLSRVQPVRNDRIIIYGGGVLGVIAALACRERGCQVTLVERTEAKRTRLRGLCEDKQIMLSRETAVADFDVAINCCADHVAFNLCITQLRKGGRLCYFSGLEKNGGIEAAVLNLIHYRELEVFGTYGQRREHMVQALAFCSRQQHNLRALIERFISPAEVEAVLPQILAGTSLRFIIKFGDGDGQQVLPVAGL